MIVCHCNAITDHDIRAAVEWMRASDTQTIITPGKVYRALGKRRLSALVHDNLARL